MAEPKKPQDHKPKAEKKPAPGEYLTFHTADGREWTAQHKASEVLSMGWVRRNRDRSELDYVMSIVELLIGDDKETLAAWDSIPFGSAEYHDGQQAVSDYIGATLGE